MRKGSGASRLEQEDCQTAIENLLTARIGATGGRLHAGRSRNDQVLAALRLYLRDAAHTLHAGAIAVAEALDALAARDGAIALPGYTHMQQAMPSTVACGRADSPPRFATMPQACNSATPHRQESSGFRRRLRDAQSRYQPRSHPRRRWDSMSRTNR
jgi:hypothetical protein